MAQFNNKEMTTTDSIQLVLQEFYKANPGVIKSLAGRSSQHCTQNCKLWESKESGEKAFVCYTHRCVHFCGDKCDHKIQTLADTVCALTGHVLGNSPALHQPIYSKSTARVKQSYTFRRSGPSTQVLRMQRVAVWVHTAILNILCSEKRKEIIALHRSRALKSTIRACKTRGTFSAIHSAAALVCIRAGNTLQSPANKHDREIKILHKRMCEYVFKFKELKLTQRQVTAFVAACLHRLTVGMSVAGVCIFFKSPYVAAHAPAEMAHGELCNVPCRQVSAMHRLIVTAALGVSGLPNPDYIF